MKLIPHGPCAQRDTKGRRRLQELLDAAENRALCPTDYRDQRDWMEKYLDNRHTEIAALKAALREFAFYGDTP